MDTGGDAGGDITGKGGYSWRSGREARGGKRHHVMPFMRPPHPPDVDALAARVVALAVSRDALRDAPASFCSNPPLFSPFLRWGRGAGQGGAGGAGGGGGHMWVASPHCVIWLSLRDPRVLRGIADGVLVVLCIKDFATQRWRTPAAQMRGFGGFGGWGPQVEK